MHFSCPRCHHNQLKLTDQVCPHCGLGLTVPALCRHYWQTLRDGFTRAAVTRCPKCHQEVPLSATVCAQCGQATDLDASIEATLEPPRRRWRTFLRSATPATRRRIQWVYLLGSAAGLWWMLAYVEEHFTQKWLGYAALSVVYLAVLSFLAVSLIPPRVFQTLNRRASIPVKLALVANYLTLLLLLQVIIGAWWARALLVAGLFLITWLGAAGMSSLLASTQRRPAETGDVPHTKTRAQGRKAVMD